MDRLSYLAGYIEGEGCFGAYWHGEYLDLMIQIVSTDSDVIERVAALVHGRVYKYGRSHQGRKDAYAIRLFGKKAAGLMMELYPLMGKRRQAKIVECLNKYHIYRSERPRGTIPVYATPRIGSGEGSEDRPMLSQPDTPYPGTTPAQPDEDISGLQS